MKLARHLVILASVLVILAALAMWLGFGAPL